MFFTSPLFFILALPPLLVLPALVALLLASIGFLDFSVYVPLDNGYIFSIIFFSIYQAFLSCVISVLMGAAIALSFYRRNFIAKRFLWSIMGFIFILSPIIVIFATIDTLGRQGLIAALFPFLDMSGIFGLKGIVFAHVYFNLPFAVRIFWRALSSAPHQQWQIAKENGMSFLSIFKAIELPIIKKELPDLLRLIFLFSLVSFAIIWVLGGSPANTTLELAIYQSLNLNFDITTASRLAWIQCGLVFLVLLARYKTREDLIKGSYAGVFPYAAQGVKYLIWDYFIICAVSLFLILPLASIGWASIGSNSIINAPKDSFLKGFVDLFQLTDFFKASFYSVTIAFLSGFISVALALAIGIIHAESKGNLSKRLIETVPLLSFAFPAFFLGAGWLILLRITGEEAGGWLIKAMIIIAVNSLGGLCIAFRCLQPTIYAIRREFEYEKQEYGIGLSSFYTGIFKSRLKNPLRDAFIWCFALAFGDLGLIALFGGGDIITIPLLLKNLLGSYRGNTAEALIILMLAFYAIIFFAVTDKDYSYKKA